MLFVKTFFFFNTEMCRCKPATRVCSCLQSSSIKFCNEFVDGIRRKWFCVLQFPVFLVFLIVIVECLRYSGMWRCITGQLIQGVSRRRCWSLHQQKKCSRRRKNATLEDETITASRNVESQLRTEATSHPRRTETSILKVLVDLSKHYELYVYKPTGCTKFL